MNRVLSSAVVLVLVGTKAYPTLTNPAVPSTVRVLTYNIHHGEGTDGQFDLPRLADVIKSAEPDLVALQEMDEGTERASGVDQLAELGRSTGMYATFGKAMDFQGGGYGVGVLSRWPILSTDNRPLPGSLDREPRTALTVEVKMSESAPLLEFTSTHLDQGRELGDRVAQAYALNERLVRGDRRPTILAGDTNSGAESEVMQILDGQWTNASPPDPPSISPTGRPQFRVDYVLVRPAGGWRVIDSRVVDAPVASDHRPVLVVLESTGGP